MRVAKVRLSRICLRSFDRVGIPRLPIGENKDLYRDADSKRAAANSA